MHRLRTGPGLVRLPATLMIMLTLLMTAGCGGSSPPQEKDTMKEAFEALLKRPSITAVEAEYQSMFQTIRERLVAEVGVAGWVLGDEPMTGSACGGSISNLDDAEQRTYDAGMSPGNLPDHQWDQAVAIVTEVARKHGFGAPEVIVNGPGDHEVSLRDPYHGELLFGTGAATILGGSTGCHLIDSAHQRGTYLPPKKY